MPEKPCRAWLLNGSPAACVDKGGDGQVKRNGGQMRWFGIVLAVLCLVAGALWPLNAARAVDTTSWFRLLTVDKTLAISMNGTRLSLKAKRIGDVTLVPLSVLHQAWGAVYARSPDGSSMTIGSCHVLWQGMSPTYQSGLRDLPWGMPPFMADGQLYVPLTELMQPMGAFAGKQAPGGGLIVAYSTQWQKEPWLRQAQLAQLETVDQIPADVKSVVGHGKVVAFTFDDNWDPAATVGIARLFQQYNGHCTFFVIGTMARAHPEVIREIVRLGDDIGNHSFSHPAATNITDGVFAKQIQACEQVLNGLGVTSRPYFRFPYFAQDKHLMQIVTDQGYVTIGSAWTIEDTNPGRSVAHSIATIRRFISPGVIFVAHPNSMLTYGTMKVILPELAARGYRFVSLSELLAAH